MKSRVLFSILLCLGTIVLSAQIKTLTKQQIKEDLAFLRMTLNKSSAYVYLNGYDFNDDFNNYLKTINDSTRLQDFGLFLTETLGKIGDRHSSMSTIRGFDLNESSFLPFIFAPKKGRVIVLKHNRDEELEILLSKYPYLKKVDGIDLKDFLNKIRPEHLEAPEEVYFTRAVRDIRDIQKNYILLGKYLPKVIRLTLSDSTFQNDTILITPLVDKSKRLRPWDEKFERKYALVKDEDYNQPEIIKQLFSIKDNIAYIQIPEMTSKDEAPLLFDKLESFMKSIQNNSKALIIDVRSNMGGTRDLTYEFAKHFIHPDSIYVINTTKQRGSIPLPKQYKERLNSRFLFPYSELDDREQRQVTEFLRTFKPMYELDNKKYSEYYFGIFNGNKLSEQAFYYNKPVYILANEKTFSAASVFVSAFKGIPNIKIVGIKTDGSSGNSEWFDLPNSKLFGKISTMVSFQKNGNVFDGFGTTPDIKIERNLNQVLWRSDYQLERLRTLIQNGHQEL